jgi:hypothetical protein
MGRSHRHPGHQRHRHLSRNHHDFGIALGVGARAQRGVTAPVQHTERAERVASRKTLWTGHPADALRAPIAALQITTVARVRAEYLASRFNADSNTVKNKRTALKKFCADFGDRDPQSITPKDVIGWIAALVEADYKPSTTNLYALEARLLFDFAKVDPNPFRDPTVQLPKQTRDEPNPPVTEHYLAALEALGEKWRLPIITIEQGGLREGEAVH